MNEDIPTADTASVDSAPSESLAGTTDAELQAQVMADLGLAPDGTPAAETPPSAPASDATAERPRGPDGKFLPKAESSGGDASVGADGESATPPAPAVTIDENGQVLVNGKAYQPDELVSAIEVARDPFAVRSEAMETFSKAAAEREQAQAALKQIVDMQQRASNVEAPPAPTAPPPQADHGFDVPEDFDYTDPRALVGLVQSAVKGQLTEHMGQVQAGIEKQRAEREQAAVVQRGKDIQGNILAAVQTSAHESETLKQIPRVDELLMGSLHDDIKAGSLGLNSTPEQVRERVQTHARELEHQFRELFRSQTNTQLNSLAASQKHSSVLTPPPVSGITAPGAKVTDDYNPQTLLDPNELAQDMMRTLDLMDQASRP